MSHMGRRERRTPEAIQRRFINSLVSRNTYRDTGIDESINTLTSEQIETTLIDKFGEVRTGLHLQFVKGEITADSRGRGSLQKIEKE